MRRHICLGFGLGLVLCGAASAAWAQASPTLTAARDALTAGGHPVTQEIVTLTVDGQAVIGTLALPGDVERPPVALLLHGFTGSRDELPIANTDEGVFSRTARRLAEHGVASLRIDFRGSGESDGAWEDTTFTGQTRDALAAIDWLAGDARVDGERLAVIGWSQGGLVAAGAAAADPRVDTLVLWAPVAHPLATYPPLMGADTVAAGLASGGAPVHVALPWGAEFDMRTPFFEELYLVTPLASIAHYPGPLLVIVGTRDTIVQPQPLEGRSYLANHDGPEELLVLDTDHVWDAFGGPDMVDEMALWSLAWIGSTL
ncbi:MAG: alpha/beta fold hydrolase [Alphaproteobacteria bacterium]